jgi:hypothetical protein
MSFAVLADSCDIFSIDCEKVAVFAFKSRVRVPTLTAIQNFPIRYPWLPPEGFAYRAFTGYKIFPFSAIGRVLR